MDPIKVLIIEDDRINCRIYQQLLSGTNTNVDFVYDGLAGIKAFLSKKYELIIIDLGLPNIGGIEVATFIRTHEMVYDVQHVPIIVITADSSSKAYKRSLGAGADEYLNKPFNIGQFKTLLSKYQRPGTSNFDNNEVEVAAV